MNEPNLAALFAQLTERTPSRDAQRIEAAIIELMAGKDPRLLVPYADSAVAAVREAVAVVGRALMSDNNGATLRPLLTRLARDDNRYVRLKARDALEAYGTIQQDESKPRPKVFIVHGRDDALKEGLARFLERLGLDPIILHEHANSGQAVIEKIERHSDVKFAVVLLSPDDEGKLREGTDGLRPRPRQNVVFELGYFLAKLGRGKVCALLKGEVEIMSDYQGILYVPVDPAESWKLALARELRAANIEVDLNRAL